ncbi:MAG: MmgE/PrpD family protein, partial [Caldimonas sp.]
TAVDVCVTTSDGRTHERALDIAPGFPGNGLDDEQQLRRFHDCMAYAAQPLDAAQVRGFLADVAGLATLPDARTLLDRLITSKD